MGTAHDRVAMVRAELRGHLSRHGSDVLLSSGPVRVYRPCSCPDWVDHDSTSLESIRRQARGSDLLFLSGAVVLVLGSHHFQNGWPGTGAHRWEQQGIVPGGLAAFTWASTLGVSSYWTHPGALAAFPPGEIAWMAVSLIATACLVIGAAKTIRRLDLSPRTLRYETRLAQIATFALIVFLAGAGSWIFDGGPGPKNLFHVGLIDIVGVAAMAGALVVAAKASCRAGCYRSPSAH